MSYSAPRRPASVDDVAVPNFDLVGELVEGLAEAARALLDHVHVEPVPKRPALRRRARTGGPPLDQRHLAVLDYPRIDSEWPLGPCLRNPMGEGSEDCAVPAVDPAELRLGQLGALPDPLP
jgi:hypothetical protein